MVQVDVFGIREETPAGACSCGGACASTAGKTMGETKLLKAKASNEIEWINKVNQHSKARNYLI